MHTLQTIETNLNTWKLWENWIPNDDGRFGTIVFPYDLSTYHFGKVTPDEFDAMMSKQQDSFLQDAVALSNTYLSFAIFAQDMIEK